MKFHVEIPEIWEVQMKEGSAPGLVSLVMGSEQQKTLDTCVYI
jgi:hypothetical protein